MESRISLIVALTLATCITKKAFHSPNPIPKERHHTDSLLSGFIGRLGGPTLREHQILSFSIVHIIVAAIYPNLQSLSPLCPYPEHINGRYFEWSTYVRISVATIFVFGAIRLYTFRALGKRFTFELAKPDRLITTSIYAYAQHPSYFPDFVLSFVNIALFANWDGAFGCFLPLLLVNSWERFKWPLMFGFTVAYWWAMWSRIRDEEEMLEEAFGEEWRDWHQKTARLIPGVF